MELPPEVLASLEATGTPYEMLPCDPDLADTETFCRAYGFALDESANSILVASKRPAGSVAVCVALANTRLDVNHRVRDLLEVKKLSFASPEVTRTLTGMEIGGVTPFGLPPDLRVFVDAAVMSRARVIFGAGTRSAKIRTAPSALLALSAVEVVTDLAG